MSHVIHYYRVIITEASQVRYFSQEHNSNTTLRIQTCNILQVQIGHWHATYCKQGIIALKTKIVWQLNKSALIGQ